MCVAQVSRRHPALGAYASHTCQTPPVSRFPMPCAEVRDDTHGGQDAERSYSRRRLHVPGHVRRPRPRPWPRDVPSVQGACCRLCRWVKLEGALLCLVRPRSQCFQSEDTQQGGKRTSSLLTCTPGSPTACALSRGPRVALTVSSCLEPPGPAPGSTEGRAATRRTSEQLFPAECQGRKAGSRPRGASLLSRAVSRRLCGMTEPTWLEERPVEMLSSLRCGTVRGFHIQSLNSCGLEAP